MEVLVFKTMIEKIRTDKSKGERKKIMKGRAIPFYLFLFWFTTNLYSQNFIIPDTVCVGEILEMDYSGVAQEFCFGYDANFLNYDLLIDSIVEYPENETPLFCHFIKDDLGNYNSFATNFTTNNIVRLEFGNNLLNAPIANSIPINEISGGMEGIQILNDNNQWWGFIIGGTGIWDEEYFLRLNFGNSLSNIPTVENLGAIGGLSFPHDLFFIKENDNWIGITINKFNNTITRFQFGDNLSNTPTATNLGNIGNLFRPTGFFPIQVDEAWHLFITNSENNTLSRVDFGLSLLNVPNGTNLGSFDILNRPRDLLITKTCDEYIGLVLNKINNEITLLEFEDEITSIPIATSLGNIGYFSFPHSISNLQWTDDGIMFFVTNVDSKQIIRVFFKSPTGLNIDCKESLSDFKIMYSNPGIYNLQIIVNQGLTDQFTFCKDIVVLPRPILNLGTDTTLCQGESLVLNSDYNNTIWQNQIQNNSFEVFETQQYIAEVTEQGCTSTDSIFVDFKNCEICLVFPNVFTPDGDGDNDIFQAFFNCNIDFISFQLEIYNRWGRKVFQTNDPWVGWDGYFKNQKSMSDVYVWKTYFSYYNGFEVVEKSLAGDLTLLR